MTRTQQSMSLALDRSTVAAFYPDAPARHGRAHRIPLSPEILEVLPGAARSAIRKALARGGMEAFLLDTEGEVCVVIRNRRRY